MIASKPKKLKLNHAHMRQWIAALRSGEYQQGREQLRTFDDRYCCLGVACNLAGVKWTKITKKDLAWARGVKGWRADGQAGFLPARTQKWLGLENYNPWDLSEMNDLGWSFQRIANFLEKKLATR